MFVRIAYAFDAVDSARDQCVLAAIACGAWLLAGSALAAPGDLDPSFGADGLAYVSEPGPAGGLFALALQPDGKIVASGGGFVPYSSSAPYLVRFDANGGMDDSFGSAGVVLVNPWGSFAKGLAIEANGKILTADGPTVLRYSADGVLETTFANDLHICSTPECVSAIAVQTDGKVLSATGRGLVRHEVDGSYDSGFGSGGLAVSAFPYRAMALQSDGKIVVAGGTRGLFVVARYDAGGQLDPTFGSSGGSILVPRDYNTSAFGLALQPDGSLIVVGTDKQRPVAPRTVVVLMRFAADETPDASFGINGVVETPAGDEAYAWSVAVQTDGKILVAGQEFGMFVHRYQPDGTLDMEFGSGGIVLTGPSGAADALALQPNGRILVAGWHSDGVNLGPAVARYMADDSALLNTPVGSSVSVVLDPDVIVTFASVTQAGTTSVTASSTGPAPPIGFQTGDPPTYYDLVTTATCGAPATVCIGYDPTGYSDPSLARLFHYEAGAWSDVTTSNDTASFVICGETSTLSPFAVMVPASLTAQVQQPINADGSSVFAAKRGVIPVKFTLAAAGRPTCSLPLATIALSSTNAAVEEPVSEAVYAMAADSGWYYRIDGCKYAYHLNAKPLPRGGYVVHILIDNVVVGSARFALR